MKILLLIFLTNALLLFDQNSNVNGLNVRASFVRVCNDTNYPNFLWFSKIQHMHGNIHKVDLNFSIAQVIGDNTKYAITVLSPKNKQLLRIPGKNVCKGLHKYLGSIFRDVLAALDLSSQCPLQIAARSATDVEIDVGIIDIDIPVKGFYKGIVSMYDAKTNAVLGCIEAGGTLL